MFVFYDWPFPHVYFAKDVAYFPFNSWLSFQRLCHLLCGCLLRTLNSVAVIDMAGRQHQVNEFHCLTGCRSEYWGFSNDACGYLTQRKTGVSAQKAEWDSHIPFTLTAYPRYPYYNPPSPLQKSHWICTICRSSSSHSGSREQLHHLLHTGDASRYNNGLWRTRGQAHDDGIYRASTQSRAVKTACVNTSPIERARTHCEIKTELTIGNESVPIQLAQCRAGHYQW